MGEADEVLGGRVGVAVLSKAAAGDGNQFRASGLRLLRFTG